VGLRLRSPRGDASLDLGYANATGLTTGTSLTAGLGNTGAFFLSLTLRHLG
jgi:hypothetical protein